MGKSKTELPDEFNVYINKYHQIVRSVAGKGTTKYIRADLVTRTPCSHAPEYSCPECVPLADVKTRPATEGDTPDDNGKDLEALETIKQTLENFRTWVEKREPPQANIMWIDHYFHCREAFKIVRTALTTQGVNADLVEMMLHQLKEACKGCSAIELVAPKIEDCREYASMMKTELEAAIAKAEAALKGGG